MSSPFSIISGFFVSALLSATSLLAGPAVQLSEVAGKTSAEVAYVLGSPIGEEAVPQGIMRYYRGGEVQVIYVNDRCNWILIPDLDPVKLGPDALGALGLRSEPPTYEDYYTISWRPHSTYSEVSIVGVNGAARSACVKVR